MSYTPDPSMLLDPNAGLGASAPPSPVQPPDPPPTGAVPGALPQAPNDPMVSMFVNSLRGAPAQQTPQGPASPAATMLNALTTKPIATGNPAANSQPGLLKKMLLNFVYTGGETLKHSLGMPTDHELQAQAQAERDKQQQMAMAQQNQASEIALRTAQMAKLKADAEAKPGYEKQDPYTDLVTTGGMKPQEALATINGAKLPVTPKTETELYMAAAKGDPAKALAMQSADKIRNAQAMRDPALREMQMQNIQDKRVDQSYKFHTSAIDKLEQPLSTKAQDVERLQGVLDQNSPQADAMVAPQLIKIIAGGQGSGLKINQAEIERTAGGAGQWQKLQSAANQWALDPAKANSILPAQRKQIRDLLDMVRSEVQRRQNMIGISRQQLSGSDNVNEHKQIYTNLRNSFDTPMQKAVNAQDPLGLR